MTDLLRRALPLVILLVLSGIWLLAAAMAQDEGPIDVARGRALMQRAARGETLSPEDQAYLDRVRQQIQNRAGQGQRQVAQATPAATAAVPANAVGPDTASYR